MTRYHINPTTGNPGRCTAREGNCPFGADAPHFSSQEEALAAAEKSLAGANPEVLTSTKKPAVTLASMDTVVPERKFDFEAKRAVTSELSTHDVLLIPENRTERLQEHRIVSLKRGTKYLTIHAHDPQKDKVRPHHIPLGTSVEALVKVETEASKAVRKQAEKELGHEYALKRYVPQREKAVAQIQERVTAGHGLDSHLLNNLVEAEAQDSVMKIFAHTAEEEVARGESKLPYTTAYEMCKEEFERSVLSASTSGNNQSTSAARNLFERAKTSAQAAFITRGSF